MMHQSVSDDSIQPFEFDAAISFLSEDESLAVDLTELLAPHSVFFFPRAQREIRGTDLETELKRIFEQDSRIVVVLCGKEWGKTPWTRMEQTAIRDRAYDDGYDFVLFVALEEFTRPTWLPKARLWHNLDRFGLDMCAELVKRMIVEQGGDERHLTIEETADQIEQSLQWEEEKRRFMRSAEGQVFIRSQKDAMFSSLQSRVQSLSANRELLQIAAFPRGESLAIQAQGRSLVLQWEGRFDGEQVNRSSITAGFYRGLFVSPSDYRQDPEKVREYVYEVDMSPEREMRWRLRGASRRITTSLLAEDLLREFLRFIKPQRQY